MDNACILGLHFNDTVNGCLKNTCIIIKIFEIFII